MVAGVFTARWTFPTLLKGTSYIYADLMARKHLLVWAVLAGALWAVANTLTVYAIRDVGLAIAFPLWNTNALVGLLWGRILFRELEGAGIRCIAKVIGGSVCIIAAAVLLGFSALHGTSLTDHRTANGVLAALAASLMWGTMYVPYRKAYLSGMNPLSFVTIFTVGELSTMLCLTWALDGGSNSSAFHLDRTGPYLFWLFLGGFVWVIGDMFQQFAAKYLGIGRGIPLSNTNQLWGLAWAALVFGELASADIRHRLLVVVGSVIMLLGALLISTAKASQKEDSSRNIAMERECERYGLDYRDVLRAQSGQEPPGPSAPLRWWDYVILFVAITVFLVLGARSTVPPLTMNLRWVAVLTLVLLVSLAVCGRALYKLTRFS
jgi:glucose uptake protein GlcU